MMDKNENLQSLKTNPSHYIASKWKGPLINILTPMSPLLFNIVTPLDVRQGCKLCHMRYICNCPHTRTRSPPIRAPRRDMEGIRPLFSLDPTAEALNPRPSLSKYLRQARSTHSLNQNSQGGGGPFDFLSFFYLSLTESQSRVLSGELLTDVTKKPVSNSASRPINTH